VPVARRLLKMVNATIAENAGIKELKM